MVAIVLLLLLCSLACFLRLRALRASRSATNRSRADGAERELVTRLERCGIPRENLFHDLFIKKTNGEYSQFDAVAITSVGVVVFEVKSYSGDIVGDGRKETWHQYLADGRKHHRFYNPVFQNDGHITTLRKVLPSLRNTPIFSVVVFFGDCHFRSLKNIPERCHIIQPQRLGGTLQEILTSNPTVTLRDREGIVRALRQGVANGANRELVAEHTRTVQRRYGNRRRTSYPLWPRIKRLLWGRRR